MCISAEERDNMQQLVAESADTASITQKLYEFIMQSKAQGRRSWGLLSIEKEVEEPRIKVLALSK